MSEQIIIILDELAKRFGVAIDWTQQNVVPYIQQLSVKIINYEVKTSWMWIWVAIIFMILAFILFVLDAVGGLDGIVSTFGIFLLVIGVITLFVQINDLIACNTFPEKIILQQLQYLIKK